MSLDVGPLREELEEEMMNLDQVRQMWLFCLEQPFDTGGLEELMIGIQQLLPTLKRQHDLADYHQATVIHILTKIVHEYGTLPTVEMGAFLKDFVLKQEAVEKLEKWRDVDVVNLYSLLQDAPSRSFKRSKSNTHFSSKSAWAVRWIALLAKMACVVVVHPATTVEWTTVETTVRKWLAGTCSQTQVTAGLACAALDILDSATATLPTVGTTQVTGLTPRRVLNMLEVPRYVVFEYIMVLCDFKFEYRYLTFSFSFQQCRGLVSCQCCLSSSSHGTHGTVLRHFVALWHQLSTR